MQTSTQVRVVLMTAPDPDTATRITRSLVEERLVACGNVVPGLTSIYRWDGEVQEDPEVLVILKTDADSLPTLLRRAHELHPYEVPELLALPVTEGLPSYLEWVADECGGTPAP
jgi:periplasmic divalent cation tolerance protein